jgi:hypothetical protein
MLPFSELRLLPVANRGNEVQLTLPIHTPLAFGHVGIRSQSRIGTPARRKRWNLPFNLIKAASLEIDAAFGPRFLFAGTFMPITLQIDVFSDKPFRKTSLVLGSWAIRQTAKHL